MAAANTVIGHPEIYIRLGNSDLCAGRRLEGEGWRLFLCQICVTVRRCGNVRGLASGIGIYII